MINPASDFQDGLAFSAPCQRNSAPILAVLQRAIADCQSVLEIASGTGQHLLYFASYFRETSWQPTEPIAEMLDVISARANRLGLTNVQPPFALDVFGPWPQVQVDAVITANMLHIAKEEAVLALVDGARSVTREAGKMHIYGPFKIDGQHTSQGNAEFDQTLRARGVGSGIRDMELVVETAQMCGWRHDESIPMPANNYSLLFTAL